MLLPFWKRTSRPRSRLPRSTDAGSCAARLPRRRSCAGPQRPRRGTAASGRARRFAWRGHYTRSPRRKIRPAARTCGSRFPISASGAPGTCRRSPSAACAASASSAPSSVMSRSMRSIMPSLVSQFSQSSAWILLWRQPHRHALERHLLVIGIKPQRHRRAGAEPGQQEIVGPGAGIEPAELHRLVGQQPVRPAHDLLLEFSAAGFAHQHDAGLDLRRRHRSAACRDNARPRRRSRSAT